MGKEDYARELKMDPKKKEVGADSHGHPLEPNNGKAMEDYTYQRIINEIW